MQLSFNDQNESKPSVTNYRCVILVIVIYGHCELFDDKGPLFDMSLTMASVRALLLLCLKESFICSAPNPWPVHNILLLLEIKAQIEHHRDCSLNQQNMQRKLIFKKVCGHKGSEMHKRFSMLRSMKGDNRATLYPVFIGVYNVSHLLTPLLLLISLESLSQHMSLSYVYSETTAPIQFHTASYHWYLSHKNSESYMQ
ncbi:hypothetical protein EDC96DRAFT_540945 [Choanephora cucurbitarum]|nr:hypothetical protein EDC96DRAFT_540945 [Choanephora cucurbitarum]